MERFRHLIGLLVLAIAGLGGWWLVRTAQGGDREDGYRIVVELAEAHGLRNGAQVRHRGVVVGEVRDVVLGEDAGRVQVALWLQPGARAAARVDSRFWVVSPRFQGLLEGVSGLDTLIRDTYLAFSTPEGGGPVLPAGSLVQGLEGPPKTLGSDRLPPVQPGDLLLEVLVPENFGLRPGSPVRFRGIDTGEVRDVQLDRDGTHVAIGIRIRRDARRTVTDQASFWVARPDVGVGLLKGIQVAEVAALLEPYVAYHAEPGQGLPVEDGWRVLGAGERPDLEMAPVPKAALGSAPPRPAAVEEPGLGPLRLVRVAYLGIERDYFSPNDEVRLAGVGLLYRDGAGQVVVLTARSACDGAFVTEDTFGEPEMQDEQIRIELGDGTVLRATRRWVDPAGNDLAVLEVLEPPGDLQLSGALAMDRAADAVAAATRVVALGADGEPLQESNAGQPLDPAWNPEPTAHWRGAPLVDERWRVLGVLGAVTPPGPLRPQGLVGLPKVFLPADEDGAGGDR